MSTRRIQISISSDSGTIISATEETSDGVRYQYIELRDTEDASGSVIFCFDNLSEARSFFKDALQEIEPYLQAGEE